MHKSIHVYSLECKCELLKYQQINLITQMDQKITQMDQKYEIINKEWIQNNQELLRQSEEGFDQDKRYYTRHADNQTIVYAQGEELGRGKYGKVIKATPYVLDNNSKINKNPPIAMKVFFNQSEKAKEEENKKEMKIIDLYYETDFYGKYPVTTMPLIEGKTLSEFIGTKTCYTMSLDTKLEFCKKILAKCKDFKNRTGHIHGDLHGDNIKVILKNDPDYNDQITVDNIDDRIEVKLIDFGKAEKNGDHQSEVYRLCENFRLISGVNQTSANGMYDIVHQVVSDPDFSDKLKEEFIEKFKEELKETYKEEKGKKERKLTSNDIIIETNFGKHHYIEVKVKDKSKSNKNEESDSVSTDGDIIQYNGTSIMTNHALIEYLKEEDKQKNIMKKGTLDNVQRLIEQIEENNKILIAEYLQRKDKLDKLNIKNEKTLDNMRKLIEHIEEHIEGSNKKIQYNQNTFNEEWHPLTSLVSQMDKQYRPFGWKTECKFPFDAIELALDIKTKQEQEQFIEEKQKFDIVVVDPPSFAKQQSDIDKALQSYSRLAKLAIQLVRDGGYCVMASCSSRITADQFYETVENAFSKSPHRFRLEEKTFHDIDHPIGFPEGAYLKTGYYKVEY